MGYICYDVRCPNCAEAFYETTELYDPNKMTTGEMLRFKKKYGPEGYNWSLPFSDYDMSEGIVCVECGGPLAPSGKVKVEPLIADVAVVDDFYDRAKIIDRAVQGTIEKIVTQLPITLEGNISEEIAQGVNGKFQEPEGADDPLTKYLKQENCPECGRFFGVDEWEEHLNSHRPEVKAQILKMREPIIDNPVQPAKAAKKAKSQKGQAKLQAELIPEPDEPLQCPMCEATFATDKQGDYDAHFKTHDLGGVQQAVRQ